MEKTLAKIGLDDNEIKSIVGPRQVGKTTLMGQLIENQIKTDKINPKKIVICISTRSFAP